MDLQQLVNLLHDPTPQKRVAALRTLAMLEETRAINAIVVVYKNDPDVRVREIAKWAGSIIWRAKERGYSTEAALQEHFNAPPQDRQREIEAVLARSVMVNGLDGQETITLENQMALAQTQWEQIDNLQNDPRRYDTQIMNNLSRQVDADDLDLLDAGLSNDL